MSAPKALMQECQQRLVDERGGYDGRNLQRLMAVSRSAHLMAGSHQLEYGTQRAVRGIVLGSCAFEIYCQYAMSQMGTAARSCVTTSEDIIEINPGALDDVPERFVGQITRYYGDYLARYQTEAARAPAFRTTGFGYYERALSLQASKYFAARIAAKDYKTSSREGLRKALAHAKDGRRPIATILADNVAGAAELTVAAGVGLCLALGRVATVKEHREFLLANAAELLRLASANDSVQMGSRPALPFGYPKGVLESDPAMLQLQPIRAVPNGDGFRAEWTHPTFKPGNWSAGEYCPGSKEYPLQPRIDAEMTAVRRSLAANGLGGFMCDASVASGVLVLNDFLPAAIERLYPDPDWQEQVLQAHIA